ncbi:hypothetical protein KGF57_003123 [Candida theae]|uniref:Uncharacterized protein n=1 Tax=Candida theae TaxID=1198502 RepID=A0AAD5BEY3_9ASCO|nr:uncharacterized protein KGF57_003123 [Candida theae]KAI5957856.1 hypothetical protein KGF57_003123 [Candida theae]
MTSTKPNATTTAQQQGFSNGVCEAQHHQPIEGSSKDHQNQNAPPENPQHQGEVSKRESKSSSSVAALSTTAHLKSYPIIASSESLIKMIPLSGYVTGATKSTFAFIRGFQPFKYLVETSDIYSNLLLTKLDTIAPSLQTVEVQDLTNPITTPVLVAVDTVNYKISAINETVSKHIVEPVNKTIVEPTRVKISSVSQELHNKTHDEHGKNIFIKPVDPVVAPFNESLEQFVDNHFPNHKKLHEGNDGGKASAAGTGAGAQGNVGSEIARTFKIVGSIMTKESIGVNNDGTTTTTTTVVNANGTTSQNDKSGQGVKKTSRFFQARH